MDVIRRSKKKKKNFFLTREIDKKFMRYNFDFAKNFMNKNIGNIMRAHEHKKFFGTTWYMIGCFWTLILYKPVIAMTAILFL